MPTFEAKDVRNIVLLGHSSSGKTTLIESMLASVGIIPKMGSVNEGTTVSDYNEDEKEKKHSASSSLISFLYNSKKINVIDTPGYTDFAGEMVSGIRAADACIVVLNGTSGVEIGTEKSYRMAKERGVPCLFFVNMLDREHSDYDRCFDDIRNKFRKHCVAVDYPTGKESSFKEVVSVITKKGIEALPDACKSRVLSLAGELAEAVVESDDALLEKYLDKGELSPDELSGAFKKAIIAGEVTPILAGSAAKNIGIKELLDMITMYLPSAADRPATEASKPETGEKVTLESKSGGPLAGIVFKTLSDPYIGQISMIKIVSGSLKANSGFYNVNKSVREKIGPIFTLMGKNQSPMESIQAGDIGCVSKLKDTVTGDSIGDDKNPLKLEDMQFPTPAIAFSLKPKSRSDEDKLSTALHKISAEDPTFHVTKDEQTKEMIASGMGDIHIGTMINRMKMRYGVHVDLGTPKVAYKETIMGKADAMYRHKKQSGGAGQFGEVWLRVEPLPRGAGFEFADEVVGGAIPRPFIVSCEKGVHLALHNGPLAGFPVVDVKAVVYDGKTHPVDSKDIAFQIAARHAFKDSMMKARPVLLEPIMDVDIVVPDEFMGDIAGSLNSRRGRVMGMEPGDGFQTIKAKVPLEEMYKYVNELKSITGGRGTYSMTFSHYEVVPGNLAQAIIDKAKLNKKEEVEE